MKEQKLVYFFRTKKAAQIAEANIQTEEIEDRPQPSPSELRLQLRLAIETKWKQKPMDEHQELEVTNRQG